MGLSRCVIQSVLGLLLLLLLPWHLGLCGFVSEEESLRSYLLSNYSTKVRPKEQTQVLVGLNLFSLNVLDISSQSMSLSAVVTSEWTDDRLVWNPANYGNITRLITPREDIWTPPMVVENSISDIGVLGWDSDTTPPLEILNTGYVVFFPPGVITTTCEVTIANYPFDTQTCTVTVIGWTYTLSRMNVTVGPIKVFTATPNGEFDLVGRRSYYTDIFAGGGDTYRRVHFELSFRRKWQFYGQNLIMPIVLNAILMNAVFALPIESGEKMGYALTVLLSYIVFLTWVTENLPAVSTDTSILQVYLAVVLCLGCLATLLTTWVLRLYHTPKEEPVTLFYHFLANRILRPWRNLTRRLLLPKCGDSKKDGTKDENKQDQVKIKPRPLQNNIRPISSTLLHLETVDEDDFHKTEKMAADDVEPRESSENPELTWQELAVLCDQFFCHVFSLMIFTSSFSIIVYLYAQY